MGLLSLGTPLDWHQSRQHNEHVRDNGIAQLINIFSQHVARDHDRFLWGDEVEYMLVDVDRHHKTARLNIEHDGILDDFNDPHKQPGPYATARANNIVFHPEYGRFMIEATPLRPFDGTSLGDYVYVEHNMRRRRAVAQLELPAHVVPLTLTAFPRMGCGVFTQPPAKPIGPASQSLFLPDEVINRHVRFPTLTANIRQRRGTKVAINVPIYPDADTKLMDALVVAAARRDLFAADAEPYLGAAQPGHVYMDLMGFGMGLLCLQVTMQPRNIREATELYDVLAPLTPVLLALTAAAPIFKGYLVAQDVRWNVISGAVDDRTFVERDAEPYRGYDLFGGLAVLAELKNHVASLGGGRGVNGDHAINDNGDTAMATLDGKRIQKIPKSRYDSIDGYLHERGLAYNDIRLPINTRVAAQLSEPGVAAMFSEPLRRHFAHLFIRDPLVLFSERIHQDNSTENDHFENIQLTNWQTLRFKPPAPCATPDADLAATPGWRVEVRPMEIQLTDFENAAYLVFVVLLSRALLKYGANFYVPISRIDENMATAHAVDAALDHKFWFRAPAQWGIDHGAFRGYDLTWFDRFLNDGNDLPDHDSGVYLNGHPSNGPAADRADGAEVKLSCDELVNGSRHNAGLLRLVVKYIATELVPEKDKNSAHHCGSAAIAKELETLQAYLLLVSMRAAGKIPTTARYLRDYVMLHPKYQRDSVVSDEINYDLVQRAIAITDGQRNRDFFGEALGGFLDRRTPSSL